MAAELTASCPDCGADNDRQAAFCDGCGAFLHWDDEPVSAPVDPPTAPEPTAELVRGVDRAIDDSVQLAEAEGRADLKDHLEAAQQRLQATPVPVVVCGEFKHGKSTLINALLLRSLCPVDEDIVTAVPTMIKYDDGDEPYVQTLSGPYGDETAHRRPFDLAQVRALVTEEADPQVLAEPRVVEIGFNHRMLKTGLCLVDTPGTGGLDSAHGILSLGALATAKGVLFVSDASQELTAPELKFLELAISRCPRAALVVTKIDLYPQWADIVELNRGHLRRAGFTIPTLAVSSVVRRAVPDTVRSAPREQRVEIEAAMNAESGFSDLVSFLAGEVVPAGRAEAARTAAYEVDFVADQLQHGAQLERRALASPRAREEVVADLDATEHRARALAGPSATWQQTLGDGVQDLVSDVEHDLQGRLRTVIADAEKIIDDGDPEQTWPDVEEWLRRNVATVTVENRDLLVERTEQLASSVAEQFDLQAGSTIRVRIAELDDRLDSVSLAPASSLSLPGGKLAPVIAAARTGIYLPMVGGSIAATMFSGPFVVAAVAIAGISIALGAGIGRKIIKDQRAAQRAYRQQHAKVAMRKFIDDVAFVLNKQTRDELRLTQRLLRDDFQARAALIHRSALDSIEAVNRTAQLEEQQKRKRRAKLDTEQRQLTDIRAAVQVLVDPAAT